ncbi:DUF4435 domain-containing protein [Amycolatopsis suaedae]|uniref:DUF4435 domain-containing protein n=1 Tax=Amycolatopsis suaedae TaxID=2510978 RepID=A0A4Q7J4M4_9PSEU|nr:DUF4435 domain-containing protein [Amycolatopsis suaedae]RZQ61622.1 DUF4435 domain-containing protein [Amycolatopsis suaedae]
MKELITGDDIYAAILMFRTIDNRTIVLLEGQDDQQALDIHIDEHSATSINCFGKPNVLRAVGVADEVKMARVLAVVDRDWDDKLGGLSSSPNIVYTEHYDLDATMARVDGVLDRVAHANGSKEVIQDDLSLSAYASISEVVIAASSKVGLLRFLSVSRNWELNMREFPIVEVLDYAAGNCGVDPVRLVSLAMRRSKEATALENDVLVAFVEADFEEVDRYYYCCGHDLRAVLAALINSRWGGSGCGKKSIGVGIRTALSCAVLIATRLYSDVVAWAIENKTRVWSCGVA